MSIVEEWEKLINENNKYYIFGLGNVTKRILSLMESYDLMDRLIGIIVSKNNDENFYYNQIKIYEISDEFDFDGVVLVSTSKPYHPEVFEMLEKKGFKKIIEAHKFYNIELQRKNKISVEENKYIDRHVHITERQEKLREEIIEEYKMNIQTFGDYIFYQSLDKLGIKGERPSSYRIEKYGVRKYLNKEKKVLDIGCNCGFIDLMIAECVKEILGVEYSKNLVRIANKASKELGISNVNFISSDFKEWYLNSNEKYDVIFSFAVHVWLNVTPTEYADILYDLLGKTGYLFFESQTLESDILYPVFCLAFEKKGFRIIKEDIIKDDGVTNRKFSIFKKI